MPTTIKPTSLFDYIGAIVIIVLFVAGVLIVWNITRGESSEVLQNQQVREIVECPPTTEDYQQIKDVTGQTVQFADSPFPSYGRGKFKYKGVVIIKIETEKSKVACGYISIRASTDGAGLKKWENVYINPNQFGGHLSRESQFGLGDGQEYSDYLFSLSDIYYWPNRNDRAIRNADWASLLNVSDEVTFEIALNTTNPTGMIEGVSLTYKCWNPKTGEENKDCKIRVDKVIDSEKRI